MIKISDSTTSYALFKTAWGTAGLAGTDIGIRKLVIPGESPGKITAEILQSFPHARPGKAEEVKKVIAQVQSYFAGEIIALDIKVDLGPATPFQKEVYQAMRRIPYGQTWSYARLAKEAGHPGAARAVGSANACNRVPIIIPCHRVICSDGSLGGFSGPGGIKTKKSLLDMEASATNRKKEK